MLHVTVLCAADVLLAALSEIEKKSRKLIYNQPVTQSAAVSAFHAY